MHPRRGSTLLLTAPTPRVVGHIWSIGWGTAPTGHLFPTTLLSPEPWRPRVSSVMFHGELAHRVYFRGMFLSTHLHNPCLCSRGHDLSDDDNIMGLWLLGIHGQVVAHIRKHIGVVVPPYVLIVVVRGCFYEGAVPRSPSYGESFRGGVVVAYVAVVLVFDYPFMFCRGGFHHTLVVKYDFVPFAGQFGGKREGDCFSPVNLLRSMHVGRYAVVSIVYAPSRSSLSF